jgi:hypothetical protein
MAGNHHPGRPRTAYSIKAERASHSRRWLQSDGGGRGDLLPVSRRSAAIPCCFERADGVRHRRPEHRRRRDAIERLHGSVQTGATEYQLGTESSAVFSAQERSRSIEPTPQTLKSGRIIRRMLRQYADTGAGTNASSTGVPKAPVRRCESSRSGSRNDNQTGSPLEQER